MTFLECDSPDTNSKWQFLLDWIIACQGTGDWHISTWAGNVGRLCVYDDLEVELVFVDSTAFEECRLKVNGCGIGMTAIRLRRLPTTKVAKRIWIWVARRCGYWRVHCMPWGGRRCCGHNACKNLQNRFPSFLFHVFVSLLSGEWIFLEDGGGCLHLEKA